MYARNLDWRQIMIVMAQPVLLVPSDLLCFKIGNKGWITLDATSELVPTGKVQMDTLLTHKVLS
jgi:hypothetical protein